MSSKPKILITDDEFSNTFVLKKFLSEEYEIKTAKSGKEALELVKSFEPDLLLLDIIMPEISGLKVCEILSRDENFLDMPIILITSKSSANDIKIGFEAGATDYLSKPFSKIELEARIKAALKFRKVATERTQLRNKIGELKSKRKI